MAGILSKDRPDKDADIVILTKYLVSPDIALDFIKAIRYVKDDVKDSEGNEIYSLVKTKVGATSGYINSVSVSASLCLSCYQVRSVALVAASAAADSIAAVQVDNISYYTYTAWKVTVLRKSCVPFVRLL